MFNREICNDGKNKVTLLNIKQKPAEAGGKSLAVSEIDPHSLK